MVWLKQASLKAILLAVVLVTVTILVLMMLSETMTTQYIAEESVELRLLRQQQNELTAIRESLNELKKKQLDKVDHGNDFQSCEPSQKIAFCKTHKTGSSTLQNIFLRYGVNHDLTFAFPNNSWMFSIIEPFNSSLVLDGPFKTLGFDMFVSHSQWRYHEVQKVVPNAKYVTILRDPVDALESNYVFMGAQNSFKMDINGYADKFAHQDTQRNPKSYVGRNNLLWDLGMNIDDMGDREKVRAKLDEIEEQFDLVLISERFQESVLLMADTLCWDMADVVFQKQLERVKSERTEIKPETRAKLQKWLWADYMLYDFFVEKLEEKIEAYGRERMEQNVQKLNSMIEKVKQECVLEMGEKETLHQEEAQKGVKGVYGYDLDLSKPWCQPFFRRETEFAKSIRDYQYAKALYLSELRGEPIDNDAKS